MTIPKSPEPLADGVFVTVRPAADEEDAALALLVVEEAPVTVEL
jgi:hypothetical protein